MNLGPRLVIPGAIFGGMFLAVFLFFVTAGFTYPAAVQAAEQSAGPEVQPTADPIFSAGGGVAEEVDPQTVETDYASQGEACRLSGRYPDKVLRWCDLIMYYADKRGLSPNLVAALILQESGGNEVAYSHSGAVGLMQVMPRDGLAAAFMCQAGPCFSNRPTIEELKNPEFNISYGTKMLSNLIRKYGDVRAALKAYGPMDVGFYYADIVMGIHQRYADGAN
jgi:hypothetical protein